MKSSVLPLTPPFNVHISRLQSRKTPSHLYVVETEDSASQASFGQSRPVKEGSRLRRRLRDVLCILLLILLWLSYLLFPLLF